MLAMLLTVNTASFVAMQNRLSADFITFASEGIAAMAGIGFTLVWTQLARPVPVPRSLPVALLRAGWSDLAENARRIEAKRL